MTAVKFLFSWCCFRCLHAIFIFSEMNPILSGVCFFSIKSLSCLVRQIIFTWLWIWFWGFFESLRWCQLEIVTSNPTNKNLSRSWSQVDSEFGDVFFPRIIRVRAFTARSPAMRFKQGCFCTVKIRAQNCIRTTKGRWAVQAVHQQSSNWVDKYRSPTKLRTKLLFSSKRKNKRSSWVSCFPGHWMKLENSWWLFDDG